MAVNKHLKSEDYTESNLIKLVRESLVGYVEPGQKVSGTRIFYVKSNLNTPRHDVIFYWRALYVLCIDEYDFAIKVFDDWSLYNKFVGCSSPYRNKFKQLWDDERERKNRSKAMANIVKAVEEGDIKESKWLEKHIIDTSPKEEKKKKVAETKGIVDDIKPTDDIMDDIVSNYKNVN